MSGEEAHEKGRDGAQRAKQWLESTTRVNACWVNPDKLAVRKLTFPWAAGSRKDFSYDLGGLLLKGDLDGKNFLAEVKNYRTVGNDQNYEYEEYLAKNYCAFLDSPRVCDSFMWITWHPFHLNKWSQLCSPEFVFACVLKFRVDTVGEKDEETAKPLIDMSTCEEVAERLWLIVLSDKQETLTLSDEHRGLIENYEVTK